MGQQTFCMNIFVLHENPLRAAHLLCDQHVVKMFTESCQILCTVAHMVGVEAPYKPTHRHHPCVKWAAESFMNYSWLIAHALGQESEYRVRFGKDHKTSKCLSWIRENRHLIFEKLPKVCRTPFAQAMPEEYQSDDAVASYRRYYKEVKGKWARYKYTPIPKFMKEEECLSLL